MMHINIMIATYDRWELLRNTLRSLTRQTYKDFSVHIIVDGNQSGIPEWLMKADVEILTTCDRSDVVAAWGIYTFLCETGLLLHGSDDLVFHPECLSAAVYGMKQRFPRGMGVIGINQLQNGSPRGRHYAFTLMNRAYIDHFPDRVVFCPDYIHYRSDMEHGLFAQSIGCFRFCPNAKLDHIRVPDETTRLGKQVYKRDKKIFQTRQEHGFLWGKNFDRIT